MLVVVALPMAAAQLPDGLRERAEQGAAAAQADLGRRYYAGQGVPQDDVEAARWTGLAAEQGHAPAQYNLGLLYFRGRGVTGNDAAAARWYRSAAEQGYPPAQAALSSLYLYGAGVDEDPVLAAMWMELAWQASVGAPDWRLYAGQRAELASAITAEQIAEGRRLAREWTPVTERRPSGPLPGQLPAPHFCATASRVSRLPGDSAMTYIYCSNMSHADRRDCPVRC